MSYYGQGPPSGPPYQQSSYTSPPPGAPQGHYPPQGYDQGPAMNQSYPPQGYPPRGYPPQNYPPQQGYPPQGYSPQQGYGSGYGPSPSLQGQYDRPPPPPPGQYGNYGPPQGQYGGGGYGAPAQPPAPPSPGYIAGQQSPTDMSRAADELRAAMKGFGTDERILVHVLASLGPLEVQGVKAAFEARHHRDLMKDVHSETSGHLREGLLAIIRGPLDQDVHVLHDALHGPGTKESALNEVLLARSNADLNAIKARYQYLHGRSLDTDVRKDLSMKTERMFEMVLAARRNEESHPVYPPEVDNDVRELYGATEGRMGKDQMTVCAILTSRSAGQLRAIAIAYRQKYQRSLDDTLRKEFTGHMEQALLFILRAAEDQAKHDADRIEDAVRGLGTHDHALIRRVVAVHWDRHRVQQCKGAYHHFYKQELAHRLRAETSGDYERLLVACIGERS